MSWCIPATSFPQFKALPPELQLLIWTFALHEPRAVCYAKHYYDSNLSYSSNWRLYQRFCSGLTKLHYIKTTYPGILGACYDSRMEAIKHYTLAFAVELGEPIHFDFKRDVLEFGDFASLQAFSQRNTPFSGSKLEADLVQVVGLTVDTRLDERLFVFLCSNFGNMKVLMMREGETPLHYVPNRWPLNEFPAEEIAKAFPRLGDDIRRNIRARGGNWRAWKPPSVWRGRKGQWSFHMEGKVWKGMDWEADKKVEK